LPKVAARDPNLRNTDLEVSVPAVALVLTLGLSEAGAAGDGSGLLLAGGSAIVSLFQFCDDASYHHHRHRPSRWS
jgi:hypothetical protein